MQSVSVSARTTKYNTFGRTGDHNYRTVQYYTRKSIETKIETRTRDRFLARTSYSDIIRIIICMCRVQLFIPIFVDTCRRVFVSDRIPRVLSVANVTNKYTRKRKSHWNFTIQTGRE